MYTPIFQPYPASLASASVPLSGTTADKQLVEHPDRIGEVDSSVKRFCLYILLSEKTGRHYTGSTNDVARRLEQHNRGLVRATKGKGPWLLEKTVFFDTETQAKKAEYHLKRQKSRIAVQKVIEGTFSWPEQLLVSRKHGVTPV